MPSTCDYPVARSTQLSHHATLGDGSSCHKTVSGASWRDLDGVSPLCGR